MNYVIKIILHTVKNMLPERGFFFLETALKMMPLYWHTREFLSFSLCVFVFVCVLVGVCVFHGCLDSFMCAVTCTLHYCYFSCWVLASYSNPKEGKKQIKKSKKSAFLFSVRNTSSLCRRMPTFVWSDEIDCVNSECSAKVLMDVEKGNFQWQSTVD